MNGMTTTQEKRKPSRIGTVARVGLASLTIMTVGTGILKLQCGPESPKCKEGTELVCRKLPPPKTEPIVKAQPPPEFKLPPKPAEKAPPVPVKVVTKGPTKGPEKQPEPPPKEPVVAKPAQQDAGPVEDKTACNNSRVVDFDTMDKKEKAKCVKIVRAMNDGIMQHRDALASDDGRKVSATVQVSCDGEKTVVSIRGAGEHEQDVKEALESTLGGAAVVGDLKNAVRITLTLTLRSN